MSYAYACELLLGFFHVSHLIQAEDSESPDDLESKLALCGRSPALHRAVWHRITFIVEVKGKPDHGRACYVCLLRGQQIELDNMARLKAENAVLRERIALLERRILHEQQAIRSMTGEYVMLPESNLLSWPYTARAL